nr:hypothetical protein [Tanacetum cinerariifolium]
MARQCPKPKRKRDATLFNDKVLLVEAQGNGKVITNEELEFLADPGVTEGPFTQMVITHNAAYQADDLDAYDSDRDDFSTAKAVLMANLSSYRSDVLSEEKKLLTKIFSVFKNEFKKKEAKNIDKEIALEKKVKELDNIICKIGQSAQTVHMLTKLQVFYDNNLKQALGFQIRFYLKNAHQIKPMLYDDSVIAKETNSIAVSEETLMLEEENFGKRFVPQQEFSDEHVSRSKSTDTTKKDRILQISSSTQMKNKVGAYSRIVKSCLNKPNCVVEPSGIANVQHSKLNSKSKLMCVECNSFMFDTRHELCFLKFVSDMNASSKSKSIKKVKKRRMETYGKVFTKIGYNRRPTGRTFTLVGNTYPLTRITTTNKVPLREPIPLKVVAQESLVTKVYTRRPKHMTRDRSQLTNFVHKFSDTVEFDNDQIAKIIGYGDYQIGNITKSRVYYMKGLGHNLFPVGHLCDLDIEVAFRKHTCFVRNLEGVDLLLGSWETNLYTLSVEDMMTSSLICLLSKASKTKSWLWHRRLSHLNFGAINHLGKHGLVRCLPKLKFEKDHMCSACAMGKSKKQSHKYKSEDINQEKLYLLHMDLCGPMCVASVNKKSTSSNIHTDNGTEFVNQTLQDYYEQVGISYETSVVQTPQQNGVVKRQNHTLVKATRTIKPDLSYLYVFGALCYPNNDSENLGKFQAKADIVLVAAAPRAVDLADSPVSLST